MATPHRASSVAPKAPIIRHTGKLVTAAASTGAALVSIFSFLYSYGVIGRSESHQTIGNLGAAWVGVRPTADTATAIGDTIHLAATITDKNGAILVGAKPAWTSDNAKVAIVLKDGSVIATGPGSTTVTLAVGELFAKARIAVRQHVTSVSVGPESIDSLVVVGEGDGKQLRARPLDARGHLIAGLSADWHVDDSSVVSLDTTGMVTGKIAGRTIVNASVNGISGHTAVTVVATPAAIAPVAGASQRALAGSLLSQAVVVRVTSRRGRPVEGTLVKFRVADGQGGVEPAASLTDADGRARTLWTLGDLPGRQTLLAEVGHVDTALAIIAEADPIAANTRVLAVVDSEGVSGPAGAALESPVKIRVTDSTGRALPDVLVNWLVQDGGQVEAVDFRTDSLGEARAKWTLGARTGRQRLRAQVGSGHGSRAVPPVMLEATALAGAATGIVVVSGDSQRGTAGAALPKPVVIKVVDAAGNGVEDVSIVLSPSAGSVPDTVAQSDASGLARIHWTLGRAAGDHSLGLHVDGVEKSLKVTARANAAAPANLSFDDAAAADTHATHVKGTAKRLVAVVTDAFGNPVPDARLSFSSKSGSVTPTRAVSDSKGRVSVAWSVGSKAGEQSLIGAVVGSDVKGSYVTQVNGGTGSDVRQAGKPVEKPATTSTKPATAPTKPAAANLAPTKSKAAPTKAPTSRKRS